MKDEFDQWFEKQREKNQKDLFQFLSFPSVSADSKHKQDCLKCAEWLEAKLQNMGLATQRWETPYNPCLYAEFRPDNPKAKVLFYMHYDVQPADPFELWKTPPFEPTVEGDLIIARGIADNKGQCFYTLLAIESYLQYAKENKVHIQCIIEGDEETGSKGLFHLTEEQKQCLQSDYLFVVDTDIPSIDKPVATLGCRGIATLDVTLKSAKHDLHSGLNGGIALNPLLWLSKKIAGALNEFDQCILDGFYDGIQPLEQNEYEAIDWEITKSQIQNAMGILSWHQQTTPLPRERNWIEPTFELHGIKGGYIGEGSKTVIPCEATAKLSFRLIPNQDPKHILKIVKEYFSKDVPSGASIHFSNESGAEAFRTSATASIVKIVKNAYKAVTGKECKLVLGGGSLPIALDLERISGAEVIGIGFALPEDGMHAPNESFALSRFKLGYQAILQILLELNKNGSKHGIETTTV